VFCVAAGAVRKIGDQPNVNRRSVFCILALLVAPVAAGGPLEKIQSMLAKPQVLCGRFDQKKQLTGLKKPLSSSGRFCVVPDKGVLWRNLQPFPHTVRLTRDEIVQLHGDRVTTRLDAKQEPTVRMMTNVFFALLAGDFGQLEKLFEIHGSIHGNGWNAALKPRDAGLANAVGSVTIEGAAYVKNITITEANGDRTSILFSAIQTGYAAMSEDEAASF
jgi:hypothetical protein